MSPPRKDGLITRHRANSEAVLAGNRHGPLPTGALPDFWGRSGDGVEYRVGGTDGELENIDLSRALHDYFRLGDDIEAIYTELRRDPVVAPRRRAVRGVEIAAAGAVGVPRLLRVFPGQEHPRHPEQREGHRDAEARSLIDSQPLRTHRGGRAASKPPSGAVQCARGKLFHAADRWAAGLLGDGPRRIP